MAVRNFPKAYGTLENMFGYKKGDVINLKVTVQKDASSSTSYKTKKYLKLSSENGAKADTSTEGITASKGVNTGKEFYALYIGGNNSYYQLVILDADWISTGAADQKAE